MKQQFGSFVASELYCGTCKSAQRVNERLLLVLPSGELYDLVCARCASSVGQRTVSAPAATAPILPNAGSLRPRT